MIDLSSGLYDHETTKRALESHKRITNWRITGRKDKNSVAEAIPLMRERVR